MPVCHVLAEVGKKHLERAPRLQRIEAVLGRLGFAVETYKRDLIASDKAENLETQNGASDGYAALFPSIVTPVLQDCLQKGDLIIATEGWQWSCFGSLLNFSKGCLHETPIVEMWIDYSLSFAHHRIFSSRFAQYYTDGEENTLNWHEEDIVAAPYVPAKLQKESSLSVEDMYGQNPYALDSLDLSAKGIPVLAPDWGTWAENIQHGVSGALYRSNVGRELAKEMALSLKGQAIVDWVNTNYSLDYAAEQVKAYLTRLSNA